MSHVNFIPYKGETLTTAEMLIRSEQYFTRMNSRRTIREFSDKPVAKELIENIIMTASTAPSGANKQPWTFCAVSDPGVKAQIRKGAEEEEYENYHGRMTQEWLNDLGQFGTDWNKPFLQIAPWLIVIFRRIYELNNGRKLNNYYVNESVGIATGILIAAIHHAGLAALTHTPSPMNFLGKILNRPENEKPFLLIPVGYPADAAKVPDIKRKKKKEVLHFY